jgi:hypothetical protein
MVKLSLCLIKHHTMKRVRSGGIAPSFLISALAWGEGSASHPGRCTPPEERASGSWVGPRAGPKAANLTSAFQSISRRYTD